MSRPIICIPPWRYALKNIKHGVVEFLRQHGPSARESQSKYKRLARAASVILILSHVGWYDNTIIYCSAQISPLIFGRTSRRARIPIIDDGGRRWDHIGRTPPIPRPSHPTKTVAGSPYRHESAVTSFQRHPGFFRSVVDGSDRFGAVKTSVENKRNYVRTR